MADKLEITARYLHDGEVVTSVTKETVIDFTEPTQKFVDELANAMESSLREVLLLSGEVMVLHVLSDRR